VADAVGVTRRVWRWWLRTKPDFLDKPLLCISAVMVTVMVIWGVRIDNSAAESKRSLAEVQRLSAHIDQIAAQNREDNLKALRGLAIQCEQNNKPIAFINGIVDLIIQGTKESKVLTPEEKAKRVAQYEPYHQALLVCPAIPK